MDKILIFIALLLVNIHVIQLYLSGNLTLYSHPRFGLFAVFMSTIATLLLLVLAITNRSFGLRKHLRQRPSFLSVICILFCIVAITLPPRPLSPQSVIQREKSENGAYQVSCKEASNIKSSSALIASWSRILSACKEDPLIHDGKSLTLTGFVHHNTNSHSLKIARYLMSCCAVDATPNSLEMTSSEIVSLPKGQWVTINATIKSKYIDGKQQNYIEIQKIKTIKEPEQPYEYY